MVRRLTLLGLLAAFAVCVAAAAAAERDPRLEQLRLNAKDGALAKQIALRASDLGAGWKKTKPTPASDEPLNCPGFKPDLSAFTITGEAQSEFARANGTAAMSAVEVYESRADAVGDFRAAATPAAAKCLRHGLEEALRKERDSRVKLTVVSSKVAPAPAVGDRRIGYRLVMRAEYSGIPVPLYFDVTVVQRGRTIAALSFMGAFKPVAGRQRAATLVAARMR